MLTTSEHREKPTREHQVLVLAAEGMTDKEIARKLGISPETVATYWRRILQKTGAASRTEVVAREFQRRAELAIEAEQAKQRRLVTEVAERKMAEQHLRAAVNRLRLLMEHVPVGVVFENVERSILFMNSAMTELYVPGMSPSAFVGQNCSEAAREYSVLFADPLAFVDAIESIVRSAKTQRGVQFHLADGRWVEVDYRPVFADGRLIGHLWLHRDFSATKQIKLRLRLYRGLAERFASAMPLLVGARGDRVHDAIRELVGSVASFLGASTAALWRREKVQSPLGVALHWSATDSPASPAPASSFDERTQAHLSEGDVVDDAGVLVVPMFWEGELLGALTFAGALVDVELDDDGRKLLRTIADTIASALESAPQRTEPGTNGATVHSRRG